MDEGDRGEPKTEVLGSRKAKDPSFSSTEGFPGGSPSGARRALTFAVGALVGGRYRILRFIAAGGMGEVYEAHDLELGVRVALKTLRPDVTGDARALERFKQEISLARKVTHPNVCRIFDLGWHRDGEGPAVTFLTMELLPGETLAAHLRREGAMAPDRALPLLRQMAEALASAHRAGVIHRDFKSGNVMLVPTHDGFRAVVSDFGLARTGDPSAQPDDGEIVGTPAYLAPEQLRGGKVGPPADVYAFGVVMCEALLGKRPFSADSSLDAALFRVSLGDSSPDLKGAKFDGRFGPIAMRCLEPEPSSRYADGAALLEALDRAADPGRRKKRALAAGAVALMLLAAAGGVFLLSRRGGGPAFGQASTLARAHRRSVAVLGFKNLSGKPQAAWLSTALSEMLTTELAAGDRIRTVPGEAVSRMKIELGVPDAESLAPDTLAKIRANLGADFVVMGSYVALGDPSGSVRLDVRLQDAAAGETLAALAETGTEDRLADLASGAGMALRAKLGAGSVTATEAAVAQEGLPSGPEATRLYAQGLESLRCFEFAQAKDEMQKLVALSPGSPLAHAALSDAWSQMGYMDNAKAEARKAYDLSKGLPRAERLSIEGRYRETNSEWDKAAQIYRSLWTFYPDNLDYGLRLANAQRTAGDAKAALLTLGELRKLPGSVGQDPRIDLEEAKADEAVSDYSGSLSAAKSAVQKARELGARFLLGQALLTQGLAFRRSEQTGKASSLLEEAASIFESLGDLSSQARALRALSWLQLMAQDSDGYSKSLPKIISLYRKVGDKAGLAAALGSLAQDLTYSHLDLRRARILAEESMALCRELGDKRELSVSLWRLGNAVVRQGDLSASDRAYAEALSLARGCGDRLVEGICMWALADVASARGDLKGAEAGFDETLRSLSRVQARDARMWEDDTHVRLAELRLDQRRFDEAEHACRSLLVALAARSEVEEAKRLTLVWLARALLAQGRTAEARQALEQASRVNFKWPTVWDTMNLALYGAEVLSAEGKHAQAMDEAERALKEADALGLFPLQLRAQFVLANTELSAGRASQGRARLAALGREATAKGWLLVASQASQAAGQK